MYNDIFTTKETCPSIILSFVYCFTGFKNYGKVAGACPGIRTGGGGAPKSESLFFAFQYFRGGSAQKIGEKMILPTKKVAKYRCKYIGVQA